MQVQSVMNVRMGQVGQHEADKARSAMRIEGCALQASAHLSNFAGLLPGGFGTIVYQSSGTKAIVVADLEEVAELYMNRPPVEGEPKRSKCLQDLTSLTFV